MGLHILFLGIYLFLSGFVSGSELYMICTVHIVLFIIMNFYRKASVSPITLFAVGVLFANLGNIALVDEVRDGTITIYSYIVPDYIDDAALIWCVGCTMIIIGYILTARKSFPSINFDIKKEHLKVIFWVLMVANVIIIFNPFVSFKSSIQVFALLNMFGILFFARLWGKESNNTYGLYAISLLMLETYSALATSYLRSDVIFPLVCLFIGYFVGKGNVRYLFTFRMVPFLVVGAIYAITFSAMEARRSDFLGFFLETQQPENPNIEKNEKKDALLIRSANVAQITNVVSLVRRNGFYGGTASLPLVIAMVPRVLWPDKPKIQLGAWFALEIGQANMTETGRVNNSINMTVMGELYLDFGWIGVVLGSLLLGALVALLWNSTAFYSSEYNLTGSIFGGYLLLILLIGLAADLQIVITFMSYYTTFIIIKYLAKLLYSRQQLRDVPAPEV